MREEFGAAAGDRTREQLLGYAAQRLLGPLIARVLELPVCPLDVQLA
jgi:hypothetical protein